MEARIARLESDVAHVLTIVVDINTGLHALRERTDTKADRLDTKFDTKLDAFENKVDTRFEALETKFDTKLDALETKVETKLDALDTKIDRRFALVLTLGVASVAGLLGAMARGFGWI
jgi:uncharacterized coiled-coil protein SlyX